MSSRYRNDYYDDDPPYRANGSARSPRSPKARPRQMITRRGPISAYVGRRPRGSARWEPKSPRKAEEEKKGEFNQEEVEAELNKYKKGVFYFDETLKPRAEASLSNGHAAKPSSSEYSKFQLILTEKPPPSKLLEKPLGKTLSSSRVKAKSRTAERDDGDAKDDAPAKAESKAELEPRKKTAIKQRARVRRKAVVTRRPVQPIVTISPQRAVRSHGPSPYGAFVPPASEYYYASGYPYGGGSAAPSYYDLYPPNAAGYMAPPPRPQPPTSGAYSYLAGAPGTVGEDGSWYPFPEALAQYAGTAQDPYSTPKQKRSSRKRPDAANVDLTSPSKSELEHMTPGRRVNKIQKQLEYYFSAANLDEDQFLRDAMDERGWVSLDVLIPFQRMKVLGATRELVVEAAFHSTVIEIDHVKQDRVRVTALWREYVKKGRKDRDKGKSREKRRQSAREREREKLIQQELDNAEVSEKTIDAIVALVEKKQERRAKRREQREREKAKRKQQEKEKGRADNGKDEKDDSGSGDDKKDEKDKADEDPNKSQELAAAKELIKADQARDAASSKGDPDNNDMVEID